MKKGMPKQESIKEYNLLICITCEAMPNMTPDDLKEHLRAVHNVDSLQGTRQTIMHLDAQEYVEWHYEWDFSGVHVQQQIRQKRAHDDPMRYA